MTISQASTLFGRVSGTWSRTLLANLRLRVNLAGAHQKAPTWEAIETERRVGLVAVELVPPVRSRCTRRRPLRLRGSRPTNWCRQLAHRRPAQSAVAHTASSRLEVLRPRRTRQEDRRQALRVSRRVLVDRFRLCRDVRRAVPGRFKSPAWDPSPPYPSRRSCFAAAPGPRSHAGARAGSADRTRTARRGSAPRS